MLTITPKLDPQLLSKFSIEAGIFLNKLRAAAGNRMVTPRLLPHLENLPQTACRNKQSTLSESVVI
jgi:hypothetical protein